jgi:hypothetical protein
MRNKLLVVALVIVLAVVAFGNLRRGEQKTPNSVGIAVAASAPPQTRQVPDIKFTPPGLNVVTREIETGPDGVARLRVIVENRTSKRLVALDLAVNSEHDGSAYGKTSPPGQFLESERDRTFEIPIREIPPDAEITLRAAFEDGEVQVDGAGPDTDRFREQIKKVRGWQSYGGPTPPPVQATAQPQGAFSVSLASVEPFVQDARFANFTFRNDSQKPVALFYYAQNEHHYAPFAFYSMDYLQPGATFTALRDVTISYTNKIAAVVFADGTSEGSGPLVADALETHRQAMLNFALFAKIIDDAEAEGASDDVIASRLAAQAKEQESSHREQMGAEIARRGVQIQLDNEGVRGIPKLKSHLSALKAAASHQ